MGKGRAGQEPLRVLGEGTRWTEREREREGDLLLASLTLRAPSHRHIFEYQLSHAQRWENRESYQCRVYITALVPLDQMPVFHSSHNSLLFGTAISAVENSIPSLSKPPSLNLERCGDGEVTLAPLEHACRLRLTCRTNVERTLNRSQWHGDQAYTVSSSCLVTELAWTVM